MLPSLSSADALDARSCDSVASGERLRRLRAIADSQYFGLDEPVAMNVLALGLSSLSKAVRAILVSGAEEQVVEVSAWRVVAAV